MRPPVVSESTTICVGRARGPVTDQHADRMCGAQGLGEPGGHVAALGSGVAEDEDVRVGGVVLGEAVVVCLDDRAEDVESGLLGRDRERDGRESLV